MMTRAWRREVQDLDRRLTERLDQLEQHLGEVIERLDRLGKLEEQLGEVPAAYLALATDLGRVASAIRDAGGRLAAIPLTGAK